MIEVISKTGFFGSIGAALTAACCVLPVALMLLGVGGSWLGVFGPLAAVSLYLAAASAIIVSVAWILAVRRKVPTRIYAFLATGSVLTTAAWAVILNEAAINDYLMELI